MPAADSLTIGFLRIEDDQEYGLLGGYLMLNGWGRPLEFHCTSPVRPTRTHEILYGTELKPFLYGEQIGGTLLRAVKSMPALVCVDSLATLSLRYQFDLPVVAVLNDPPEAMTDYATFRIDDFQLAVLSRYASDQSQVRNLWQRVSGDYDLQEPFERIRQALGEAKRSIRGVA